MRSLILILILVGQCVVAQTTLNKSFSVPLGHKVDLYFDHPKLIKVSTWDKNEVAITGHVSIKQGERDDAFSISSSNTTGVVSIRGEMINLKNLPHRITVFRDGQKITFKTKEEYKKYVASSGKDYEMISSGVDIDIVLEIKVPRNVITSVQSVYGMVEVRSFEGSIAVASTYGGVDASLNTKTTGELTAETNYGTIYSNLDVKFEGEEKNFYVFVMAKPGSGPKQTFESKYGNVYLRKSL